MNATQRIYRLLSINRIPHPEGGQRVLAKLWRHPHLLNVEWWSAKTDACLQVGSLVVVEGTIFGIQPDKQIILGQLEHLEQPNPGINLFETIPEGWGVDLPACTAATELWESLPFAHRQLFNQMMWDGARFKRYVTAPKSVPTRKPISHFAWMIETAKGVVVRSQNDTPECLADLTFVALLLDVGSLETPRPNSYVRLLEWLLLASRQNMVLDGRLVERLAWKIVQVHGLTEREAGQVKQTLGSQVDVVREK